ncbi:hypothetical protein CA51_18580 [Rosistilla oblonga]|uniref:hypothetical protein n=1 Tax=Rosistilla oblonga TaxID=2527990 RepID=UPI0011888EF9|nr:hypothetical protein [Rosistilla oblonga]QDV11982.1 hypothetical protein CA51_18580 [Rosistilla oblonga]
MKLSFLRTLSLAAILSLGLHWHAPASLSAQDDAAPAAAQPAATGPNIQQRQTQVAENYKRLEELLIRLADVEASTHPERAALLRRAARQSSETFVLKQLEEASQALDRKQFQLAIENQSSASQNLAGLLKLLLTEDRQERIREEKDRIKRIKQDIERRLRQQTATRARTENGVDTEELKDEQGEIAEKTKALSEELSGEEEGSDPSQDPQSDEQSQEGESGKSKDSDQQSMPSEGEGSEESSGKPKPSEGQKSDGESKSDDQKPTGEEKEPSGDDKKPTDDSNPKEDSKPSDGKPSDQSKESSGDPKSDSESKPGGEQKPSEGGKPQQGQPQQGQPQQGQQGQDSQQQQQQQDEQQEQPQTPQDSAAKRLDQAQQKMREAEQQLEDAKRDGAIEKQREAEQLLRQAIEDLDRILRQLREEEKERELARLEARFRKMAEMQSEVYERTKELDEIPAEIRDRSVDIRAGNLAFEEKKIILEADRALLVLKEEGSSVAFPEVVQQMRGDMQRVSERLTESKIGPITQGLEEDILAAIEEMIAALQQAQREQEEKKNKPKPPGQPQQGQPGESPLVQPIAELKLIRTLEMRIKTTTERYANMLPDGTPELPAELGELVDELSQRQLRLYRVTRDIVLKKNR